MTEVGTRPGLGARDIVVGYGKNAPILDGLSLDVLTGELTVIVGPMRAGSRLSCGRCRAFSMFVAEWWSWMAAALLT